MQTSGRLFVLTFDKLQTFKGLRLQACNTCCVCVFVHHGTFGSVINRG